jgi:putative hydrolase of HD superfamily
MDAMQARIRFILETDRLKTVQRQTYITDVSRRENSAEHSWHLALMAILFNDMANTPDLDLLKVVKMLLIHDIVEIDAGDTFAYDAKAHEDKAEREQAAAQRLFGLLPEAQREEMLALWREFEAQETPEARFALALDRFHPMLLNLHSQGTAWRKHGITRRQVLERNRMIADGSEALWKAAQQIVAEATEKGYLAE